MKFEKLPATNVILYIISQLLLISIIIIKIFGKFILCHIKYTFSGDSFLLFPFLFLFFLNNAINPSFL